MSRLSTLFLAIVFLIKSTGLHCQSPVIEWQKCLGGKNGEYPFSIEQTSDGGFVVAGRTEGGNDGDIMGLKKPLRPYR